MINPTTSDKFLKTKFVLFSTVIPFFSGLLFMLFIFYIAFNLWRGLAVLANTAGLFVLFSVIYSFIYGYRFFKTRQYIFAYIILFPVSFGLPGSIYTFLHYKTLSESISTLIMFTMFTIVFIITIPLILGYIIASNRNKTKSFYNKTSSGIENQGLKLICPFCREKINSIANYCPICGKSLEDFI